MDNGYQVVAKDGKEYGPLDRDTIQRWYHEGRLDQNSKVFEPGKHRFRLKEIFDLTVWNNPALIAQAATAASAEPGFEPKMLAALTGEERETTPGMFAAGILLIINGVMGLLLIGLILTGQLAGLSQPRLYIVPIIDLIVAAGLIRGKEKYRKWGLVRAVLGGGLLLLGTVASALTGDGPQPEISEAAVTTVSGVTEIIFQLLFCAGIAALLWGDWPSKRRVAIGVAAVLVAWSGIITTNVVTGFVAGFKEKAQFAKYSVAGGTFEDDRLGVSARLPEGWALLTKDNPIISVPGADLIAVHHDSGCLAALLVEPGTLVSSTSTDGYLTLVLQNRKTATPTIKELGRQDVDFGGFQGRRLDTSWTSQGNQFRGFTTACKAGPNFYLLTGWCEDGTFSKAFPAFQALEKVFSVGPRPATEPPEITAESEEDYHELVFFIQDHQKLPDGTHTLLARGMHEGNAVGFELSLGASWKEGSLGPGGALVDYAGTLRYRSTGPESDSLLQALDQIYKTQLSPKRMKNEAPFTVVSLEGDPRDLENGPVTMKVFFETSNKDRYAEFFTNIDLKARKLYISEKDPEYRAAIIRAFQEQ